MSMKSGNSSNVNYVQNSNSKGGMSSMTMTMSMVIIRLLLTMTMMKSRREGLMPSMTTVMIMMRR